MKKILIIVLIILGVYFINLNSNIINSENINSINFNYNHTSTRINEKDFSKFTNLINNAKKNSYIFSDSTVFVNLNFLFKDDSTDTYILFLDKEKQLIGYRDKETSYILNKDSSKYFLLADYFNFLYKKSYPSFSFISNGNNIISTNTNLNLNYKKIDNKFYNHLITNTSNSIFKVNNKSNLTIQNKERVNLAIYNENNDKIYYNENIDKNDIYIPKANGTYIYTFSYSWSNITYGDASFNYKIVVNNPVIFNFDKIAAKQGEFITVKVFNAKKSDNLYLNTKIYNKFKFYDYIDYTIGYIPISAKITTGKYTITYGINNNESYKKEIEITDGNFKTQYLYIEKSTMNSSSNNNAYNEYFKYFNKAKEISAPKKLYSTDFILPIKGKLTTEFGEKRYINERKTSYNHTGLDIAAEKGTPVPSTNSGKITLSRFLALTGNTVVIDHGEGIFSYYQHLDTLACKEGQLIDRNEIIGSVGSTGRSTGAHLHFGISFYGNYIDPGFLIFGQKIKKENYLDLIK